MVAASADSVVVIFRIPVKIGYCRDDDHFRFDDIEQGVWESFQKRAPGFLTNFCPCFRHSGDLVEGGVHFTKKPVPKAWQLIIVIVNRLIEFRESGSQEANPQGLNLFLASSQSLESSSPF